MIMAMKLMLDHTKRLCLPNDNLDPAICSIESYRLRIAGNCMSDTPGMSVCLFLSTDEPRGPYKKLPWVLYTMRPYHIRARKDLPAFVQWQWQFGKYSGGGMYGHVDSVLSDLFVFKAREARKKHKKMTFRLWVAVKPFESA